MKPTSRVASYGFTRRRSGRLQSALVSPRKFAHVSRRRRRKHFFKARARRQLCSLRRDVSEGARQFLYISRRTRTKDFSHQYDHRRRRTYLSGRLHGKIISARASSTSSLNGNSGVGFARHGPQLRTNQRQNGSEEFVYFNILLGCLPASYLLARRRAAVVSPQRHRAVSRRARRTTSHQYSSRRTCTPLCER